MTVYTGQPFPSVTPLGVGQITTLEVVTESVLPGETLEFELDTPQSYQINSIATSSPCWLRVYGTSYARSLDTRTSPGSPFPEAGSGFFAEIQTVQGNLTTSFAPTAEVQVENTSTLFKVRNDDGSPREITITLDVIVGVYPVVPSSPPYNCSTSVDTRGQVDLSNAWKDCDLLTHLPLFDLSSATNLESAWENCTRLVYVPPGLFDNCPAANFTNVFVNCSLSLNSVDNILISLDEAGVENGIVDITGGNNAPPTVAGLAAKTNLEGKGWTVNVVPSPGVSFVDLGVGEECYAATSFEDGRVFVGTNSGNVFLSTDYGVTFDAGTLVGNGTIYNIAACNGDTVIAGTYADSFPFVTTDGGLTWGPGEDFAESEIDSVAYAGSNTVYIGTYGYIHKSTDNGQTWEPGTSPYGNDYYISLAFPGVDKVVAGSFTYGFISYSTDGGLTWDTTSDYVLGGGEAIYGLASNGDGIVVAGTTEGGKVFLSTDSGVNWDGGTQLGGSHRSLYPPVF